MTRAEWQGTAIARDLWLFGLALAVRLAGWLWVVGSGVRPFLDEDYYFKIAGGWSDVLQRLAHLSLPTESMLTTAWGEARWPPLHPFILGMARAVPTDDLSTARLVGVIAGSVTTVLVVRLTTRLAGQHAARAAGVLHALYPSFVFFSVSLWSETLFTLLLLAFLLVVVRAVDSQAEPPSGWILSLGCGSALLLLTRSAALPMVVGLLAWLALRLPRDRRLRTVAGATLVVLLLVLPWSVASSRLAGRLIVLSSSDARNLAFGNNPWTPPELGSSWGVHESRRRMLEASDDRFSAANGHAIAAFGMTPAYMRAEQRGFSTFEFQLEVGSPLRPGDGVRVRSGVRHVGNSSLRLLHVMTREPGDEVVATLEQSGVHFDQEARRPAPLPDDLRERAKALLVADA